MKKYSRKKNFIDRWAIWFLIIGFGTIYSFISVTKHLHFQTGLDLAIYVQSLWMYTKLSLPYVTLYPTYGDLGWADHFTPSLALLTPFYVLFPSAKTILILQSVLFSLGAYPIFSFAKKTLKSTFFALTLSLSYFLFFGTQFALTFDFHAATFSAIFLPWVIWFALENKWRLFFFFSLLAMGAKEDMAPIIGALGLFIIISKKSFWVGFLTIIFSMAYFFITVKFVMPGLFVHAVKTFHTPVVPLEPLYYIKMFFDSPIKIKTLLLSFGHFIFVPLLSGPFFVVPLAHFFINFPGNSEFMGRWGIYLHYRVQLAAILSFSTILGLKNIVNLLGKYVNRKFLIYFFAVLLIATSLALDFFLHLPLNTLAKKNFYEEQKWMRDVEEVIDKVPDDAFLLTQNNLFPHLANRKNIYDFPFQLDKAEYVLLDLRPDQPIIDFWLSDKSQVSFFQNIGTIKPVYKKGQVILFEVIKKRK